MVQASTAMPAYNTDNVPQLGNCYTRIRAINAGHRPVTITHLDLDLPGGRSLVYMATALSGFPDTPLPVTLTDGQSADRYFAYRDIGLALLRHSINRKVKLTPVCRDSLDNIYKGEPIEINPDEFARM